MKAFIATTLTTLTTFALSCASPGDVSDQEEATTMEDKVNSYATVPLTADLTRLTENQRAMLAPLIEAAEAMDRIFWREAYGHRSTLLQRVSDPAVRRYIEINYGPWDRLDGNIPFLESVGPKPKGANFYPSDVTAEEFEAAASTSEVRRDELSSLYTLVRRDADGKLTAVPYHAAFAEDIAIASSKLREAAELAEDPGLKHYLALRAEALLTDQYQASDLAWMDMKDNVIDVVIGPIETYEDQLFGYKAAHEAFILIKDTEWSERLARYTTFLPELQAALPVPEEYKQETPGVDSDLNAYDAIYYAGDANAGSKTIAINLPNDEQVQLRKGTRRLQLRNAMRAKFDEIVTPLAGLLIAEDQRSHVRFDAFFQNVMFHEVAHGLGIKTTLTGEKTVREALLEQASSYEEAKADVLGLYMITQLHERGELGQADIRDHLVTFLASMMRSVRFGSASAHGRANLLQFNSLKEAGAFVRDAASGTYRVDFERMQQGLNALAERILRLQGDGDYQGAQALMQEKGVLAAELQADLQRLTSARVPRDIVFEQGLAVLGLD